MIISTRREWLGGAAALTGLAISGVAGAGPDTPASFEDLLRDAENNPDLIDEARSENEGRGAFFNKYTSTLGPRVRTAPSTRQISPDAIRLIVAYEISSEAHYTAKLQGVVLPAPPSGITIGYGYDLGYVDAAWLREDWAGRIAPADLDRLAKACRKKGAAAIPFKAQLAGITVPLDPARAQFREVLQRYVGETVKSLPVPDDLHPDCLGALTSLVYNRGPSFRAEGNRYREMREIRRLLQIGDLAAIPGQYESMTRLWTTRKNRGVALRRRAEAALFRKGVAAS